MGLVDAVVRPLTVRWRDIPLTRSIAYRCGTLLARRVRILKGKVPTGSSIYLLSRDHQHRAIYFLQRYEPEVVALLRSRIGPGDVFFDVGANAGYFTVIAADLGAEVHAFEPNPRVRALLVRTAAALPGVRVLAWALSDRSGTTRLNLAEDTNTGQASLSIERGVGVDVVTRTLDEYCATTRRTPTVLKIDVERHEYAVLEGAMNTLRDTRPLVVLEVADDATVGLLTDLGYVVHSIESDGRLTPIQGELDYGGEFLNLAFL
jgi:FkbM family methyltransferase